MKMQKLFQQPQFAFDISTRTLFWGLLVLNRLAYLLFLPELAPVLRTPGMLFFQTFFLAVMSVFALTPAIRDFRDVVFFEWIGVLVWNLAYVTKSPWYEPSWFPLQLLENWMTLLATMRMLWFANPAPGSLRTDWPIFGIIGFITRHKHASQVPPTTRSGLLVWSLIWLAYPLAWYVTANKININDGWLFFLGAYIIGRYGIAAAHAFRDHVSLALQIRAELDDVLPQFEALKASLAKAATLHPPIKTRAEAMDAMKKWLSEDERTVLNAMRETHPRVMPALVDSMLNLAANMPRPPLTLVGKRDDEK
jgi:hypothetical protein